MLVFIAIVVARLLVSKDIVKLQRVVDIIPIYNAKLLYSYQGLKFLLNQCSAELKASG